MTNYEDQDEGFVHVFFADGGTKTLRIDDDESERVQEELKDLSKKGWPEGQTLLIEGPKGEIAVRAPEFSGAAFRPRRRTPHYDDFRSIMLNLAGGAQIRGIASVSDYQTFRAQALNSDDSDDLLHLSAGAHDLYAVSGELVAWSSNSGHNPEFNGKRPRNAGRQGEGRYDARDQRGNRGRNRERRYEGRR